MISITEEENTSSGRLLTVGFFAAVAFLFAAALLEGKGRAVPLVVGGGIVATLLVFAGWLRFQQKYGAAIARPLASFEYGAVFEGIIESEMQSIPSEAVEIRLYGWSGTDGGGGTFTARFVAAPSDIKRNERGIAIPFRFNVPDNANARGSSDVRLAVRTSTWPLGWGATFLVA